MNESEKIALIDLDGTIADYDAAMTKYQELIKSPGETLDFSVPRDERPAYLEHRRKLIQGQAGFWTDLPKLELGFKVIEELRRVGFSLHVLTQGPITTPSAWTEKLLWVQKHLPDEDISITRNKSLVYGRVLVDDWPDYFLPWLKYRPRGLVICVAQEWNKDIDHPNVFRYDGSNHQEMVERIEDAYQR